MGKAERVLCIYMVGFCLTCRPVLLKPQFMSTVKFTCPIDVNSEIHMSQSTHYQNILTVTRFVHIAAALACSYYVWIEHSCKFHFHGTSGMTPCSNLQLFVASHAGGNSPHNHALPLPVHLYAQTHCTLSVDHPPNHALPARQRGHKTVTAWAGYLKTRPVKRTR